MDLEIPQQTGSAGKSMLRYYIIDLWALLFMFNLSQASASTVGPIDTKICMVNLHYMR